MMSVCDERLKQRALKAMTLQSQGAFLVDQRRELPFASNTILDELRYSRERDEYGRNYDYEAPWGKFSTSQEDYNLLVLRKGRPPDGLWPQARLELATAIVHTGFVTISNNGSSFDLDMQTRDRVDYGMLRLVNQTLATEQLPVVVWQLEEDKDDAPPII